MRPEMVCMILGRLTWTNPPPRKMSWWAGTGRERITASQRHINLLTVVWTDGDRHIVRIQDLDKVHGGFSKKRLVRAAVACRQGTRLAAAVSLFRDSVV